MLDVLIFARNFERQVLVPALYAILFAFFVRFIASYRFKLFHPFTDKQDANLQSPLLPVKESKELKESIKKKTEDHYLSAFPDIQHIKLSSDQKAQLKADKVLYHELQNLEDHLDSVEKARLRLQNLLDQTLHHALADPSDNILQVAHYTPQALRNYFDACHTTNATRYERYIARRRQGGPRELLPTKEYAVQWLKHAAVVKYVDGGWVGNVLNIHTKSWVRRSAKTAWQVISEEFGDGDLAKNHVYVYNELIKKLDTTGVAPTGDILGFDGLREDEGASQCWAAAIAQQCIGLLASTDNYTPEALGFNMAYETLPYHLLVTSRELRELKIDDYYFALHITIDNCDSGHAAMARVAVESYLEEIEKREGTEAMQQAWRRVQAGVILADGLPTTPSAPIEFQRDGTSWTPVRPNAIKKQRPPSEQEQAMVTLLAGKAFAAEKMHCPSALKFGGLTIEQWLDPSSFTSHKGLEFLRVLGKKRPWVIAGQSENSKLVRELEWGGRMFGAFSGKETELVRTWIESIPFEGEDGTYLRYTCLSTHPSSTSAQLSGRHRTSAADQFSGLSDVDLASVHRNFPKALSASRNLTQIQQTVRPRSIDLATTSQCQSFALLWFTSISLLEQFPLSPAKFAAPLGATVLRILRSIAGFNDLHENDTVCAGMDDVPSMLTDLDGTGLWEIGQAVLKRKGFEIPDSFADLVDATPEQSPVRAFCLDMLGLRQRPYGQASLLLGLTSGFTTSLYSTGRLSDLLTDDAKLRLTRIQGEIIAAIQEYQCGLGPEEMELFMKGFHKASQIAS